MLGDEVQEVQGLYGPFTLSERVLQKIWLRQQFDTCNLVTLAGKQLEVLNPGKWNLLGGPDFKDATLRLNGSELRGDVEVHFDAADWYLHAHERNAAFDRVILHVLLYRPEEDSRKVKTVNGSMPETLVLMPLLQRDLESIAMDEALLEMERVNELEWVAEFLELPAKERKVRLAKATSLRWGHKLHFAAMRLERHGWSDACHQLCLEVLGYSRNREPMARLALEYPLEAMQGGSAEELFQRVQKDWKLSGVRPANHPRLRLQQYLTVLEAAPAWPEQIETAMRNLPAGSQGLGTSSLRREAELSKWCARVRESVFGNQLGESRFHTLMIDALLPLAEVAGVLHAEAYWQHWYVGDVPVALKNFLKLVEATSRLQPNTNGLTQGALGLFCNEGSRL